MPTAAAITLIQGGGVAVPPLPPEIGAVMIFNEIVLPLIGIAFGGVVVWWIYRTVNKLLDKRQGGPEIEALHGEIERLKGDGVTVEQFAARLGEVEERLDFAERLLTQHKQERLGRGG
jgi:hypothetical protein